MCSLGFGEQCISSFTVSCKKKKGTIHSHHEKVFDVFEAGSP